MPADDTSRAMRRNPVVRKLSDSLAAHAERVITLGCAAIFACLVGCTELRKDQDFARNFLIRLKATDPSIAADMDSTLLRQAGSWQLFDTRLQPRLPAGAIDSIHFVSIGSRSSLPPSMRIITLKVFGGQQYSVAQIYLDTDASGKLLVNTIQLEGPFPRP